MIANWFEQVAKNGQHVFFFFGTNETGSCKKKNQNTVLGSKTGPSTAGPTRVSLPCVLFLNIETSDAHLQLRSLITDKLCPSAVKIETGPSIRAPALSLCQDVQNYSAKSFSRNETRASDTAGNA